MTDDRYLYIGGVWMLMAAISSLLAWIIIAITVLRVFEWLRDLLT